MKNRHGDKRHGTRTAFALGRLPGSTDLFTLRTTEGSYLSAPEVGKPVILTAQPGPFSAVRLSTPAAAAGTPAAPQPSRQPTNRRPRVEMFEPREFAADPGAWDTETHSTHLWIFNRARRLILLNQIASQSGLGKNQDALRYLLRDDVFLNAVKRGIDAADNTGMFDVATSGFVFSAHFYNPRQNRGGWWDPKPEINALNYGKNYFQRSIDDDSADSSGRSLGLAIHYLQDLCQPMHVGLYPNQPGESYYGFRHENYEQWILSVQDRYGLDIRELNPDEFHFNDIAGWWRFAADRGIIEYDAWEREGLYGYSPISFHAFGSYKLSAAEAGRTSHDDWLPTISRMLKLAQRLTAGLMLAWADTPSKLVTRLKTTYNANQLLIADALQDKCIVAGDGYDGHVYHQASEGRPNARWMLEPVMKDGKPMSYAEGGKSFPVYYIKDQKHGKYLVAGDVADNHLYHQPHNGRLNAQWSLEPVIGPEGTQWYRTIAKLHDMYHPNDPADTYPLYYLRDLKHRLAIVAGSPADNNVYHQAPNNRLNAKWALDSHLPF